MCAQCNVQNNPAAKALLFSQQRNQWCAQNNKAVAGANTVFFADVKTTIFVQNPNHANWYQGSAMVTTYKCVNLPTKAPWFSQGNCYPNPGGSLCYPGPFLDQNGHLFYQNMNCV